MAGDELNIVRRYGDRLHSLHLKDIFGQYRGKYSRKNMPDEAFAPIGEGVIRTKECIDLAGTLPNFSGTFIIDQDRSARDMLEDLRIGFENISRMMDG